MENKDDIENLFQERFTNDEAPVSPRMWQNIKNTLPEEKGAAGFGFSQNMVLWSIIGIFLVSSFIGSFVTLNINKSDSKSVADHLGKVIYASKEKNYTVYNTNEKVVDKSHHNNFSHDSLSETNPYSQSPQPSNNKADNGTHSKVAASNDLLPLKDRTIIINKNHSQEKALGNSTIINNNAFVALKNNNSPFPKSDSKNSLYQSKNKNKPGNSGKEKSKINLTDLMVHQTNTKSGSSFGQSTYPKDTTDHTRYSTNHEIYTFIPSTDTINNQNKQTLTAYLSNSDAVIAETDTTHQKNNPALSFYSSNLTNQHNDSLRKRLDKSIALSSNENVNSESSFTSNKKQSFAIQKDSLENKSLIEVANNENSFGDSISTLSDSLSSTSLAIASLRDSLIAATDSLQTKNKDSVVTETVIKKEKIKTNLMKHLSFDIIVSALLTGASTKATDSLYQAAVDDKNKNDKNSFGYSAGIIVNYKLSNQFSASAGIAYTNFSEQYHFSYNLTRTELVWEDSAWHSVQIDSIHRERKVKDQYSFISIPLQVSYTFLTKEKLRLSATAGIRTNVLLKAATCLPNAEKNDVIEMKSGFKSISFSYLLALEVEYKLTEHAALFLQPTFIYGASSIQTKASSLSQKPYGAGLTLGLRFTF